MDDDAIESFWTLARSRGKLTRLPGYFGPTTLEVLRPPAWSFGGDPEQAQALLDLVLAGTKTATASALSDYASGEDAEDESLPEPGALSIVLDGSDRPRALIVTTTVEVVPFDEVDEEHAFLEGEGDRSLAYWREAHERFFTAHLSGDHRFTPTMAVVLERFTLLYAS